MQLPIDAEHSIAIRRLSGNPITGTVMVTFKSSDTSYRYDGVSRRSIIAAILMPPLSVGQWVNRHCRQRHGAVTV